MMTKRDEIVQGLEAAVCWIESNPDAEVLSVYTDKVDAVYVATIHVYDPVDKAGWVEQYPGDPAAEGHMVKPVSDYLQLLWVAL